MQRLALAAIIIVHTIFGMPILEIRPLANVVGEIVKLNRRQTPREFAPRPWRAPTAGVGAKFQFPRFLAQGE